MDGPPEYDVCSICHGTFHVPCQANCSHWFCASCILQVWDHGSALQACKCPLCRRPITLLVPSDSASRLHRDPEVPEILRRVEQYNRRFGQHANGLLQRMQDLPFLLRRLLRDMTDPQRSLPFVIRARVYLAEVNSRLDLMKIGAPYPVSSPECWARMVEAFYGSRLEFNSPKQLGTVKTFNCGGIFKWYIRP